MNVYYQIVITTCANAEQAQDIADALVAERLAACVNIVPQIRSVYIWQGSVQSDTEHMLMIKSSVEKFSAIEARIKALHSYELPEVIAVPVVAGSADYLAWLGAAHQS